MATEVRLRGGTTSQHSTFTGASREVTVDTDKHTLVVHDGATPGGHPVATQSTTYSKAEVDTALGLKANTSSTYSKAEVDTALGLKANTSDLSGFVSTGTQTLSSTEKAQVQANIGLKAANFGRVRLTGANGYGSSSTKIRRFSTVVKNEGGDITYADSASAGATFTIVNDGIYAISYTAQFGGASNMGITRNSSQLTTGIYQLTDGSVLAACTASAANLAAHASCVVFLAAGDVIRPHADGSSTGTSTALDRFIIERVG